MRLLVCGVLGGFAAATVSTAAFAADLDIPARHVAQHAVHASPTLPPAPPAFPPPPAFPTRGVEDEGRFFGNFHAGFDLNLETSKPNRIVPVGKAGAKIAYEGGPDSFGYQVDADVSGSTSGATIGYQGSDTLTVTSYDAAAHLTKNIGRDIKFGVLAGASGSNTDDTAASATKPVSILGLTNLKNYSYNQVMAGVGVEAMLALTDTTTVQGKAVFLQPLYRSLTATPFSGNPVVGNTFDISFEPGFAVSGSISKQMSQNFSARFGGAYMTVPAGGFNASALQATMTGQYCFDYLPLSVAATLGVQSTNNNGVTTDGLMGDLRFVYSFGGPSNGVNGRLFRSGITSLMN